MRVCWFWRKVWVWLKRLVVASWRRLVGTGGWFFRFSKLFLLVVWSCLRRPVCSWVW